MQCRIADLRCKEVINVCDGTRYGYVNDVLVDTATGRLVALVVPGPGRFWSFFGKCDELIIPWESIKRIGEDIILVEFSGGPAPSQPCRPRKGW